MSDDEKSKPNLRLVQDEEETQESSQEKKRHKVIADIHSGLVMVAPVATPIEEEVTTEEEEEDEEKPQGPLN